MTLAEQFNSLKHYGYVADADDLPPREWADGKMHEKTGGKWHVVGEGKTNTDKKTFTQAKKDEVINLLKSPTDKILKLDYTRENYNKLFPEGMTETPLGKIKLSPKQFERLGEKDSGSRKEYLGLMAQTLKNPTVIIDETDDKGRKAKVWIKSVIDETKNRYYIAVVPTIDGVDVVVSNGVRKKKGIEDKIKKASIYYYKAEGGGRTTRTDSSSLPSDSNITHDTAEVKSLAEMFQQLKGA